MLPFILFGHHECDARHEHYLYANIMSGRVAGVRSRWLWHPKTCPYMPRKVLCSV